MVLLVGGQCHLTTTELESQLAVNELRMSRQATVCLNFTIIYAAQQFLVVELTVVKILIQFCSRLL